MSGHHRVAVIGGGLSGLTAARVLHTRGIPAVVFELEPSRDARVQGGMLDIHDDSGQVALRLAGLHDEFLKLVHRGGEATRVLDRANTVRYEEPDGGGRGRPEVDRGQLRDLLLDSLPDGTVRWGRRVVQVAAGPPFRVTFADGSSITADIVVGADGAWSRVRPLLTDAQPAYTGISFVEVDLRDADARHPESAAVVGGGMLFALGHDKGFLAHRETDGSLHVYAAIRADEGWADTIDFADDAAAKAAVLEHFGDWDPALRSLVADADGPLVPRRINALPVGLTWERVPGVTLLGDAAHLMSPFAGEGANLAMHDGALLAEALADRPHDVEAALAAYEHEMFERSSRSAQESADAMSMLFAPDTPDGLVAMFSGLAQGGPA